MLGDTMPGSARTRILLVDSHHISLTGLRTIFEDYPDLHVEAGARDGRAARESYRDLRPDVVVVNTHAQASETIESILALSDVPPRVPPPNILVLLDNVDDANRVIEAGVRGLLSSHSSSEELAAAVRLIATGRSMLIPAGSEGRPTSPLGELTTREAEVFHLVARGYSNAEISAALTLSQSTVKSHIQRLMEKLGLRNRVHAVIFAYEKNVVHTGS
ncbi:response regulator transcription factor [Kitasatospora sp. NPDC056531]|uniref:response regulator transcription factor n=1 Tax=Kitasatospora sp. NPDC056531 TaxID=3345856 RepID=UPI0036C2902D